jgi:hypothetical protein
MRSIAGGPESSTRSAMMGSSGIHHYESVKICVHPWLILGVLVVKSKSSWLQNKVLKGSKKDVKHA